MGRMYNPTAFYVKKRRAVIDWMCEMGEDLRFEPETIHHSISVFDSYFQIQNIQEHLDSFSFIKSKTSEQVIQLVAVVCMFISAKYGEKTYPGVLKLTQISSSPFTYEEFITMETDMLNTLKWEVFLITPYIFTQHFIA